MLKRLIVFSGILLAVLSVSSFAAVPKVIDFQGKLTNQYGTPETGNQFLTFNIYAHEDDVSPIWHEDNLTVNLDDAGQFSAILGSNPSNLLNVDFSQPLWLEVVHVTDAFVPRQRLTSAPYAFYAITAESVVGGGGSQWQTSVDNIFNTNPGNVGIGTTDPTTTLKVVGSAEIGNAACSARGANSVAMGEDTTASGEASTAMGWFTTASGPRSTAMGEWTLASGMNSTAMGYYTSAGGNYSTAMGAGDSAGLTTANGNYSTAMGYQTLASGNYSTAMGYQTNASQNYSTAMGASTNASGSISTAMGYMTNASGFYSTAMGYRTIASGEGSIAMGYNTIASGEGSIAMGSVTNAIGITSTAMGYQTNASGNYSTAIGYMTNASGDYSTAMGMGTKAIGLYSTAMGHNTNASGESSVAMGSKITAQGDYSVGIGLTTDAYTITQPNTMAIMGGNVSIGTTEPNSKLTVAGTIEVTSGGIKFPDHTIQTTAGGGGSSQWTPSGDNIYNANIGSVGIGTTSPGTKLHVGSGNIRIDAGNQLEFGGAPTSAPLIGTSGSLNESDRISLIEPQYCGSDKFTISYRDGGTVAGGELALISAKSNSSGGGAVTFYTQSSGTGFGQRMIINGAGNVGIGNTMPAAKLHVDSGSSTGAGLRVDGKALITGSLEVLGEYIIENQLLSTYETIAVNPSNTSGTALTIQPTGDSWSGSAIQYKNYSGDTTLFEVNNAGNITAGGKVGVLKVVGSAEIGSDTCSARGQYSVAMGFRTIASGFYSTAMGGGTFNPTTASGDYSVAMGYETTASGDLSTSMGYGTKAMGRRSTAMGQKTTAQPYASLAIGQYNVVSDTYNKTAWAGADPVFIIGNGTAPESPSNAMTVLQNGNVGIGTTAPTHKLDVAGDINASSGKVQEGSNALIPRGVIVMWSGLIDNIPAGWALCNGANGTPDLQDRFIVGAGTTYAVSAEGGTNTFAISTANLPPHTHSDGTYSAASAGAHTHNLKMDGTYDDKEFAAAHGGDYNWPGVGSNLCLSAGAHTHDITGSSGNGGFANTSIENRPPYFALAYIMKL